MFKKKTKKDLAKEEPVNNDVEQEEEIVKRTCPDANTAITIVRDAIRDYVSCICNISKQHRTDINTCVQYLIDYVKEHNEIDTVINNIDDNSLIQYSNTFERNGYVIDIKINKSCEAKQKEEHND